ncbi:MAG: hypothetical protein J6X55_08035 [Victivallales bacterium]|nr:hypothetical protein [Victivallales bacterium]
MEDKPALTKKERQRLAREILLCAAGKKGEMTQRRLNGIGFARKVMVCTLFLLLFLAFCGFLHEIMA